MYPIVYLIVCALLAPVSAVTLVDNGVPVSVIALPTNAEPIAAYAAGELAYHIERASGAKLDILNESLAQPLDRPTIYIGATKAAREAGIDPQALASEEAVLLTLDGNLYIVGNDGPG